MIIRGIKNFQKAVEQLDEFQETKQQIVYRVNDMLDQAAIEKLEKERNEAQREIFKEELIERIKTYLLDLPIADYNLDYGTVFKLVRPKYEELSVNVFKNTRRSMLDKFLDKNIKTVKVWRITKDRWEEEIVSWEINDILKFHNALQEVMLMIGKQYGFEPEKSCCVVTPESV